MIWTTARYLTPAPYTDASMIEGKDADGNTETLPRGHRIFRQPDEGPEGYLSGGGVIDDYVEPAPTPFVPHLNGGGLVRFSGASPTTVYEAFSMLSVTRVAKGRYRAYHEAPMPSDQYSANPSVLDINPRIARVTARTPLYVEVRVTDLAGVAQDPAEITVETQRVIYS